MIPVMMDINTALVCTAVFVFSAIMVYLISVFGMKERTYEEAIEEQRRRNQEASHHIKPDKSRKDKKFKKWSRRKEKSSEDEKLLEGSIELEHNHSDFKTESTVMEDSDTEPKANPKKRSKFFASKISSLNRDEATQLSSSTEETDDEQSTNSYSKNFQENDAKKLLGDQSDLEQLQNEKDNEIINVQEEKTYKQQNSNRISKPVDQLKINDSSNLSLPSNKSSPIKKKKVRNDTAGGEKCDVPGNKLLILLKNASLNDDDIQLMIDILLNKQSNGSEWTKRNDPIALLKKQLQETDSALENEQKLLQTSNAKIKELRQELLHEKSKANTNERNLREKINQQQQELQSMHNRMQCTIEQHLTERSNLQSKLQQAEQLQKKLNEEHNITVQRLQDDKSQLQQALSRLETDQKRSTLEITRLQREVEQLLSTREQYETRQAAMQQAQDDLHHQIQQLEEHIQKLISTHKEDEYNYKQHLADMSNKLQQAESSKTALAQDLQNIQTIYNSLESEGIKLRQRLEEAEHIAGTKTHEQQQLQKTLEEARKEHVELANCCDQLQSELLQMKNKENEQIENYQKENNKLSDELSNAINKLEKNMQQMEKMIDLTEHNKILEEREAQIKNLSQQLNDHSFQVNKFKDELKNLKEQNEKLVEEQCKAIAVVEMTADKKVKESEIMAAEKIKKIQDEAEERLQEIQKEAEKCKIVQKSLEEANVKIANLQKKASEVDKKIDEISREANIKIVEAQTNADDRVEQILTEAAEKYNELHQDLEERLKEQRMTHKEEIEKLTLTLKEQKQAYSNMEENFMIFRTEVDEMLDKARKETENEMLQKQNDLENKARELQDIMDLKNKEIIDLKVHSSELKEWMEKLADIFEKLFPDVDIDFSLFPEQWCTLFEEKVSNNYKKLVNEQKFTSDSKRTSHPDIIDSKIQNEKLEAQVHHYKKVLSETEDILNKLQTSVECEELNWKNKLKAKDDLIRKVISEKEEITRRILEDKYRKSKDFEKELQEMGFQLEKERKANSELSDKVMNLSMLIKTSQDALKAEQDLVKELKTQLCIKDSATNGPTSQSDIQASTNSRSVPVKSDKPKKSRKRGSSNRK